GVALPKNMRLKVFPGSDSQFELYEDDGETQEYLSGACARTTITQETLPDGIRLRISPSIGTFAGMPEARAWILEFENITDPADIQLNCDGERLDYQSRYDAQTRRLTLSITELSTATAVSVQLHGTAPAEWSQSVEEKVAFFLQAARLPTAVKWMFKQRLPEFLAHP